MDRYRERKRKYKEMIETKKGKKMRGRGRYKKSGRKDRCRGGEERKKDAKESKQRN